jgi:putative transposase
MSNWHHSPLHVFLPGAAYMVTSGTLHKEHFFGSDEKLKLLQETLFGEVKTLGWVLQSWAIFSNHYHFIAIAPDNAQALGLLIRRLHSKTARELNRLDATPGRQVWFQFWDTCLTYEKSYLARLKYVNYNAVHHGIVPLPEHYPYCSASWLTKAADAGYIKKLESFRIDRLNVKDDF